MKDQRRALCGFCARWVAPRDLETDSKGNLYCGCGEVVGREEEIVVRDDGRSVFDAGSSVPLPKGVTITRAATAAAHGYRGAPDKRGPTGPSAIEYRSGYAPAGWVAIGMAAALGSIWFGVGTFVRTPDPRMHGLAALLLGVPMLVGLYLGLMTLLRRGSITIHGGRVRAKEGLPLWPFKPAIDLEVVTIEQVNCHRVVKEVVASQAEVFTGERSGREVIYRVMVVEREGDHVIDTLRDANLALSIAHALRTALGLEPGCSDGPGGARLRRAYGFEGAVAEEMPSPPRKARKAKKKVAGARP